LLGLRDDVCFERFGRFGPYEYGYDKSSGGTGEGLDVESWGSGDVWAKMGHRIDWRTVDWGDAQERCLLRNQVRFPQVGAAQGDRPSTTMPDGLQLVPRSAVVLRTWTGFNYTSQVIMNLRALVSERALNSGAEYDVHFLVHVKDNDALFWESGPLYEKIRVENVPEEFQGLVTLWSERQMEVVYPGPFYNDTNISQQPIHHVYRSAHMPLQHFAIQHPQYQFFWNWEMDIRYTGHYYELFQQLGHSVPSRWASWAGTPMQAGPMG